MYISKITIKGFRSFNTIGESIITDQKLNGFIGLNSAGKTAALEALLKVFGITSQERNLFKQDFHISKDEGDDITARKLSIEVILSFDDSEEEEIPHFFNAMVINGEDADPYIRIRLESVWTKTNYTEEGDIDTKLYFVNVPEGEEETEESKNIFPKHLRGLVQAFYVPAIRKPSDQMRYISGSILYRLLNTISFDDEFKATYKEKIDNINDLFMDLEEFSGIETHLASIWSEFHKDERYKDIALTFGSNEIESILKRLEVSFSPTEADRPYRIDELGEGYRSLFYFTLICTLLKVEEELDREEEIKPLLTILAIEEPENHIAPQLLGRVVKVLTSISEQENAQVFISSHTPAIVKRIPPESIFHFRITATYSTEIHKIHLPVDNEEAYKYVKEAVRNYPEIYFARLVVIGEGESENIIFNHLMEVYDKDFDDNIISFAPLGHRFVNHIWKLLETLNIPYITLLDLDVEREGGGWGRIKYALKQLIQIGIDKKDILALSDGTIMSDKNLEDMHNRVFKNDNLKYIMNWVKRLKDFDVFYSTPLDLDFLFLEHFTEAYKKAIPKNGGPQIPDKVKESDEFKAKVNGAVQATLKSKEATGATYTEEQKELMIWYNYHFLGRGKPVTHLNALSLTTDEEIKDNIPPVFDEIFKRIDQLLYGDED